MLQRLLFGDVPLPYPCPSSFTPYRKIDTVGPDQSRQLPRTDIQIYPFHRFGLSLSPSFPPNTPCLDAKEYKDRSTPMALKSTSARMDKYTVSTTLASSSTTPPMPIKRTLVFWDEKWRRRRWEVFFYLWVLDLVFLQFSDADVLAFEIRVDDLYTSLVV